MLDVLSAPAGGGGLFNRGGPFNPRRRGITLPSWLTGPLMASGPLPDYAWDAETGFWLAFRRAYPSARAWIDGVGGNYVAPRTKSTFSKTGVLFDTPEHVPAIDFSQGVGGIRTDVMRSQMNPTPLTCDGLGWSLAGAGITNGVSPVLAPDGTSYFRRTIEGNAVASGGKRFGFNAVAGTTYTVYGYFKAAGRSSVILLAVGAGSPDIIASVQFNLLTGEMTGGNAGMSRTSKIEPVVGMPGVFRISMTWTPTISGSVYFDWRVGDTYPQGSNVGGSYQHVPGTPQVDFWGVQLEAGPYGSPLIKDGNTTRAAENPILLPWARSGPLAMVCDAKSDRAVSGLAAVMSAEAGIANRVQIRQNNGSPYGPANIVVIGGVSQGGAAGGGVNWTTRQRAGVIVETNNSRMIVDGVQTGTDPTVELPATTHLSLFNGAGLDPFEGWGFKGAAFSLGGIPSTAQMIEMQNRMAA